MKGMRVRSFYDPFFATTVIFANPQKSGELETWMRKKKYNPNEEYSRLEGSITYLDKTHSDGAITREYLISVEGKKENYHVLLHETVHLATAILKDRDIPLSKENDEILAYLVTFWFRKLWRVMCEVLKPKKEISTPLTNVIK